VWMMGMPKDSVADEVVSSVGIYVNWEGPWCAGRNFVTQTGVRD